jgi:N-carbamoyl-L-amino-acid hydrolase
LTLPYHLEAISFTDEEGSVLGMLGSRALIGQFTPTELTHVRQDSDQLSAGLARLGLTEAGIFSARRAPESLAGFVELHIEQGARLEEAGLQIGVVTAIVGIRSYWLFFKGQAGHSGATPMDKRADALWGAADFVTQAREMVITRFPPGVMNCGQITLAPGSFNIIPAEVRLALEFRHGSEKKLDQMEAALLELAGQIAGKHHLSLSSELTEICRAAPMDNSMMEAVEATATRLGLRQTRLLSLAGHDAQTLSPFTPTALIFVPSAGGVSHSPLEYTRDEDVINGANVLLQTLLVLAGNGPYT